MPNPVQEVYGIIRNADLIQCSQYKNKQAKSKKFGRICNKQYETSHVIIENNTL
ncbi:hypothetical protein SAMN05421740_11052 [Parapedobacter koreensis]|uniref:Uncharacterized protein n=1 Tax=Parapedobacter koreensis TaxID=332977 RepID=A0A1H7T449_9SPHI|nr:hypothetical protein SAMN05421740_11052 [Parapedobacter koreensis]